MVNFINLMRPLNIGTLLQPVNSRGRGVPHPRPCTRPPFDCLNIIVYSILFQWICIYHTRLHLIIVHCNHIRYTYICILYGIITVFNWPPKNADIQSTLRLNALMFGRFHCLSIPGAFNLYILLYLHLQHYCSFKL